MYICPPNMVLVERRIDEASFSIWNPVGIEVPVETSPVPEHWLTRSSNSSLH